VRYLVAAGLCVLVVAVPTPAFAHVTVVSDDATRRADDAILTFRVPNEEDAATTTKIQIRFPTKAPLASVRPAPVPGWTTTTTPVTFDPPVVTDDGTITTGVGSVTYTADKGNPGIPVGGFEAFQVLVGPLPDTPALAFPTVQTYSNGTVVAWIQPVIDPSAPPDNPTPLLHLTPATPSSAAAPATAVTGTDARRGTDAQTGAEAQASSRDGGDFSSRSQVATARALGLSGLIAGLLALVVAGIAIVRTRGSRTS